MPLCSHKAPINFTSKEPRSRWSVLDDEEDRLTDIENQRLYLNEVCRWVLSEAPNARLHMVGFSQGVATGMRFLDIQRCHFKACWLGRAVGRLIWRKKSRGA